MGAPGVGEQIQAAVRCKALSDSAIDNGPPIRLQKLLDPSAWSVFKVKRSKCSPRGVERPRRDRA